MEVGQTLIRQRHRYSELVIHESHMQTLLHTSYSALFIFIYYQDC